MVPASPAGRHGYYGGSDFLGIHTDPADHSDPDACEWNKGWAPIYCKVWLYLDTLTAGRTCQSKRLFLDPGQGR
ncbi:MAG: hypothetical protein IPG82_11005 [Saprospiraceae bacterium]|nr:hypothetical protein [Saprospiraceae bacterium]